MRMVVRSLLFVFLFASVFSACRKDDKITNDPLSKNEYKFVRVLVSDGTSRRLTLINPSDGTTTRFDAQYANATLYPTASGRFAALLFGTDNFVQFFDSGLEMHDDHVDIKGTAKFAALTSSGPKPTHYKSRGDEVLIFNDGDGTLSAADESEFHNNGAVMRVIDAGLEPHHGAMAQFDNGTYAVTVFDKNATVSGPHAVKIIDANGETIHAATLSVSRLHGNATDGTNALFGVAGGILVVNQNGEQRVIPNPAGFGDVRLGTVLEARASGKFIGFSAAKGVYIIDIVSNTIHPLYEGTDIIRCKTDYAGKKLILLLQNGTVKTYDLNSGRLVREGKVIDAIAPNEVMIPVVEATDRFLYITSPSSGEILQVRMEDLTQAAKIKVDGQPLKLTVFGHETNESH